MSSTSLVNRQPWRKLPSVIEWQRQHHPWQKNDVKETSFGGKGGGNLDRYLPLFLSRTFCSCVLSCLAYDCKRGGSVLKWLCFDTDLPAFLMLRTMNLIYTTKTVRSVSSAWLLFKSRSLILTGSCIMVYSACFKTAALLRESTVAIYHWIQFNYWSTFSDWLGFGLVSEQLFPKIPVKVQDALAISLCSDLR